ncbi:hypothetical protein RJT34_23771 [Clitoria ternatea]|uniref:DUF7138 domain-containing protein n=1 Tax=Clitoria ternatea TaxID=43366 RepID=A0AAN9FM60_CLITE
MFDGGGSAPFAVVYSDGNREINVGTVMVDASLNFKSLLSILSQLIRISPHQFSVYLAAVGSDRKIPVTAKVNLTALRHDGGAYYFFVKRSKRSKKASPANPNKRSPPQNVMLLRRDAAGEEPLRTVQAEYERRLRNLQMEKEYYMMNMGIGVNDVAVEREAVNVDGNAAAAAEGVCEDCLKEKLTGIDAGFHLCVFDKVTVRFRTSAGPISRPAKTSGEAGLAMRAGNEILKFLTPGSCLPYSLFKPKMIQIQYELSGS